MRVEFGLINPFAVTDDTFSASSALDYSSFAQITEQEVIVAQSYATLENGRAKADGRLLIPPDPGDPAMIYQGYISGVLSGDGGSFATPPYISISFAEPLTLPGLTLAFDRVTDMWPTRFRITAANKGAQVYDQVWTNGGAVFAEVFPVPPADNLRITFLETQKARQYVRLTQLKYGVSLTWDDTRITSSGGVKKVKDIDPINRRLPETSIEINLFDTEHLFDIDKPKGIYESIQTQLPITVFYGKKISKPMNWSDVYQNRWSEIGESSWTQLHGGGYVEWLNAGTFFLDSKPEWKDDVATLRGTDLIGFMADEYYKGIANQSLYTVAVDVITDADLVPRDDHREHYVLWEGLKTVYTASPMPVLPHNDCLRLIAHAANCVYYTDREGRIHIEPLDSTQYDYYVDYAVTHDAPTAERAPTLYAVDCEFTTIKIAEEALDDVLGNVTFIPKYEVLHSSEIEIDGEYTTVIKFDPSGDASYNGVIKNKVVSVYGAEIVSQKMYTQACDLTLRGSGTVQIDVWGFKFAKSTGTVRVINPGGDPNGEIELLQNPLISNPEQARRVAEYVQYWLRLRSAYKAQYRGDPALDALDLVYAQSEFTKKFRARVLRHEWKYDGGLQGDLILKNVET